MVTQYVFNRDVKTYAATAHVNELRNVVHHRLTPATPGVVVAHALLGNGQISLDWEYLPLFFEERIPLVAGDFGGPVNWGNEDCVIRITDAIDHLRIVAGSPVDNVLLFGTSMGAASVLNWIRNWHPGSGNDFANKPKVAAIALLAPALDLEDIVDNPPPGFTGLSDSVQSTYSVYPGGWAAQAATANAANFAASYSGIPIRIWYSSNDDLCRPATMTAFAAAAGGDVTLTNMGPSVAANGHGLESLDPQDVVDWLAQYA